MTEKRSIKDMNQWIIAYKDRKQTTLQMRSTDGALLVLDAKDPKKILREIPMKRGYDLLSLLREMDHIDQARAALQTVNVAREERIQVAYEEYQRIEKELLTKVGDHVAIRDPKTRLELTRTIGQLQRDMQLASEALQKVITPVRYLTETTYENRIISIVQTSPYSYEERSIPIAKKTA
jgi:hypothetical protein